MGKTAVFTFWEPRERLVPYVGLCMKTWRDALSAHDIVVLDRSNLAQHLGGDPFDMAMLQRLPLSMQKDAIMIAVLHRHGGVFLDADTIAVAGIEPLLAGLAQYDLVMFGSHLAVMAARAQAPLLARWQEAIRGRLSALEQRRRPFTAIAWNYLGNDVLTGFGDVSRAVLSLDRVAHGFMPEHLYFGDELPDAHQRYQRYWFQSNAGVETALRPGQTLIGLHNSWTPTWYRALNEAAVLSHPCLLSRTLKHLLRL